jgi:hypothetical protein
VVSGYAIRVRQPQSVYRRRRLTAAGALLAAVVAGALVAGASSDRTDGAAVSLRADLPPAPLELPRGGRSILPERRVVAYYGAPQSWQLGALGIGTPDAAARRLARQAAPYDRRRRPVLPALELITVIANSDAGRAGMYRTRQLDRVIGRYLRAARQAKALLLLDIQPGRSDFFSEVTRLERWLRQPDVSLALDPEWRVQDGQVPGRVIGQVSTREVNATSAWLDQIVARAALPQKLLVIHQFTDDMVDETALKPRAHLDIVLNADGFGGREVKRAKYHAFTRQSPSFHHGFKLFYEEDDELMRPRDVMRLRPTPDFVVYE